MTDRELMQQALDALEKIFYCLDEANKTGKIADTIWITDYETLFDFIANQTDEIRARLAQSEPEPVAWAKPEDLVDDGYSYAFTVWNPAPGNIDTVPVYAAPPKREWQGMTDDELFNLWVRCPAETEDRFAFARAIEAKLKEKNA